MGHDDFYLAFKGCLYETRTRSKNKMDDFYPASKIKLDNFCTACTSTYLFIYLSIYLLHVYMYIYMCVFVCVCVHARARVHVCVKFSKLCTGYLKCVRNPLVPDLL